MNAPRSTVRRLLWKASALMSTVLALQVAIVAALPVAAELQEVRALAASRIDVVFLGDSSVYADRRSRFSTGDLLQTRVPERRVGTIAHAAYHTGVYSAYARSMETLAYRPRYVVVPITLRSFSVSWDRRPDYRFESTIFMLEHSNLVGRALVRPLQVFKAFDPPAGANAEYDALTAYDGDVAIGTMKELSGPDYAHVTEEHSRNIVAASYMYALEPDHRKVVKLAELTSRLRAAQIEPIFYVTPVDYEACGRLLGRRFDARIAANVEVLRRVLAAQQVSLMDLSHLLESELFNWRDELYPNEHVIEEGRRRIAAELAKSIHD
jgi:hypothetical protein